MSLPARIQLSFWCGALAALLAALWLLGDVLLPFALAAAIAYLLDPLVSRLEAAGLGRTLAVSLVAAVAALALLLAVLIIVPALLAETAGLAAALPDIFGGLAALAAERLPRIGGADAAPPQILDGLGQAVAAKGQSLAGALAGAALASAKSLLYALALALFVPVVAFYLLCDWNRLVARIDDLLPRDHAPAIRRLAAEIDRTLSGFVRGMGSVCLILGAFYAVSLSLIGLQYGLAVGVIAGLLTFIPYVGAILGGVLALGLALAQFWGDWVAIGLVAAVFVAGQVAEGNVLTPKLVGGSVGLHPVWLIFAVSAFGALFGLAGMLVAVPAAAAAGVLARFAVEQYRQGRLYQGGDAP